MLDKLSQIYVGWRNSLNWDKVAPELKLVFEKRMEICEKCPNLVEDWRTKLVNKFINDRNLTETERYFNGLKCNLCGCSFIPKISSPNEHCPLPTPNWNPIKLDGNNIIIDEGIPK